MRMKILAGAAVALAMAASAAHAQDRSIGEDAPWRFGTASDRAVKQNSLQLFELNKAGYFDQLQAGNPAAVAGAGGLLGGSAANTNNVFQFIDQSVTNNNCTASAVGASLSCSGSSNQVSNNQTSTGNTQDATTTIRDNTVTNQGNQTNTNTGSGSQTNGQPGGGA
ncbi:hypothetical protein MARCHEWKA_03260 [Brevundimonas phage vB_BpoS-Marchewka]|uniref:Uncharacterized protein n=1 Tax=Brevundimonas phage vB_BpoS-Marchewka TaxID=2948604 RepID=A0A9E7N305_9CAUD|nr:hypothetical protein MARCHEWKA_03260 [Brevundimonas phage vB_BpoS-Marchewka]UTC29285.1 hypothetical protein BAMBUS_02030 [Brevundimonas phage vB_BpoS-Bambus]